MTFSELISVVFPTPQEKQQRQFKKQRKQHYDKLCKELTDLLFFADKEQQSDLVLCASNIQSLLTSQPELTESVMKSPESYGLFKAALKEVQLVGKPTDDLYAIRSYIFNDKDATRLYKSMNALIRRAYAGLFELKSDESIYLNRIYDLYDGIRTTSKNDISMIVDYTHIDDFVDKSKKIVGFAEDIATEIRQEPAILDNIEELNSIREYCQHDLKNLYGLLGTRDDFTKHYAASFINRS